MDREDLQKATEDYYTRFAQSDSTEASLIAVTALHALALLEIVEEISYIGNLLTTEENAN